MLTFNISLLTTACLYSFTKFVKRQIYRITLNILVYFSYLPRVSLTFPVSNVTVFNLMFF